MLPGFNHNIRYRDKVFHVQTEDNGLKAPDLVTQVFLGGQIVAIERSNYGGLLMEGMEERERDQRIARLMQDQHKRLLKNLVSGQYDAKIALFDGQGSTESHTSPERTLETDEHLPIVEATEAESDAIECTADEGTPLPPRAAPPVPTSETPKAGRPATAATPAPERAVSAKVRAAEAVAEQIVDAAANLALETGNLPIPPRDPPADATASSSAAAPSLPMPGPAPATARTVRPLLPDEHTFAGAEAARARSLQGEGVSNRPATSAQASPAVAAPITLTSDITPESLLASGDVESRRPAEPRPLRAPPPRDATPLPRIDDLQAPEPIRTSDLRLPESERAPREEDLLLSLLEQEVRSQFSGAPNAAPPLPSHAAGLAALPPGATLIAPLPIARVPDGPRGDAPAAPPASPAPPAPPEPVRADTGPRPQRGDAPTAPPRPDLPPTPHSHGEPAAIRPAKAPEIRAARGRELDPNDTLVDFHLPASLRAKITDEMVRRSAKAAEPAEPPPDAPGDPEGALLRPGSSFRPKPDGSYSRVMRGREEVEPAPKPKASKSRPPVPAATGPAAPATPPAPPSPPIHAISRAQARNLDYDDTQQTLLDMDRGEVERIRAALAEAMKRGPQTAAEAPTTEPQRPQPAAPSAHSPAAARAANPGAPPPLPGHAHAHAPAYGQAPAPPPLAGHGQANGPHAPSLHSAHGQVNGPAQTPAPLAGHGDPGAPTQAPPPLATHGHAPAPSYTPAPGHPSAPGRANPPAPSARGAGGAAPVLPSFPAQSSAPPARGGVQKLPTAPPNQAQPSAPSPAKAGPPARTATAPQRSASRPGAPAPGPTAPASPAAPAKDDAKRPSILVVERSLDEVILSYLHDDMKK